MDVLNLLAKELKGKNWTKEEKAYYIYLRSCQLFSYDQKFKFLQLYLYDQKSQEEIKNRTIDLKNVEDNLVVCSSISEQVIAPLLSELIGIDSEVKGKGHIWLNFDDGKRNINADATINSDICRAKMQLSTNGYNPEWPERNFKSNLKQIAKKVGYIDSVFTNELIVQQAEKMFEEYVNSSTANPDDFLIDRLYTMKDFFGKFDKLISFSDADFAIAYLEQKFLKRDNTQSGIVQLFDIHSKEAWDFYNIFTYDLSDETLYFILEKVKNEFCFYEISKSDAIQYTKSFKGMRKEIIQS